MTDSPLPDKNNTAIMPPHKRSHKPGAPVGNNNALKHGFYARYFEQVEVDRLDTDVKGELYDEEELLRLYLACIAATLKDAHMDHDKYASDTRTVSLAVGRIESIQRSRKVVYDDQTTLDKALDELKYIPVDED